MLGIHDYWAFALGAALIVLLPGPNSIFVLTTAAREGVRRGYLAAAGVFVADSLLMLASVGGAAGVLTAHPTAFRLVKYAGALYLGWIGLRLVLGGITRARSGAVVVVAEEVPDELEPAVGSEAELARAREPRNPALGALLLGLLNPKAILFFIAFFVQFVDPADERAARQFALLAATVQCFSLAYLSALIFGGSRLAAGFGARPRLAGTASALVGLVFVGFGFSLATASIA